jgi:hypothetical protein
MGSFTLFARSKIFLTPDGLKWFTLSERNTQSSLTALLSDSVIRFMRVLGGPPKHLTDSSSVKAALSKFIISILSRQQPIVFLHGFPSFTERQ